MQLVLKRNWNCLPVFLTDVGFYNVFNTGSVFVDIVPGIGLNAER